jgi:eukaryotic translation initiation factor 2C
MPAYDGMKSLYTAGPLPFSSKEFVVKLVENDGRAAGPSTSKRYFPFESYVAQVLFSFSSSCCFINLI